MVQLDPGRPLQFLQGGIACGATDGGVRRCSGPARLPWRERRSSPCWRALSGPPDAGASSGLRAATAHVTYQTAATLTGPITTGHVVEPLSAQPVGLAAQGYVEQEFFASGTATAFRATSTPSNGDWSITPTTTAPYKTRIIVRRPADPARFNGTVIVEWMNVSPPASPPPTGTTSTRC